MVYFSETRSFIFIFRYHIWFTFHKVRSMLHSVIMNQGHTKKHSANIFKRVFQIYSGSIHVHFRDVYGFILVVFVIFFFIIFSLSLMVELTNKTLYESSLFLIYFKIIEVVGKGILLKPTTSVPFEISTIER